jgi:hypothetical protein
VHNTLQITSATKLGILFDLHGGVAQLEKPSRAKSIKKETICHKTKSFPTAFVFIGVEQISSKIAPGMRMAGVRVHQPIRRKLWRTPAHPYVHPFYQVQQIKKLPKPKN